jgi:hypothetical protein
MTVCSYCGRAPLGDEADPTGRSELRPYGKGGAPICFDCAFKSENRAETDRQLDAAFDAAEDASPVGGIELAEHGVRPLDPATVKGGEIVFVFDRDKAKVKA